MSTHSRKGLSETMKMFRFRFFCVDLRFLLYTWRLWRVTLHAANDTHLKQGWLGVQLLHHSLALQHLFPSSFRFLSAGMNRTLQRFLMDIEVNSDSRERNTQNGLQSHLQHIQGNNLGVDHVGVNGLIIIQLHGCVPFYVQPLTWTSVVLSSWEGAQIKGKKLTMV